MAYIKRLKNNELIGGTDNTDVYPVTSTEAVYGPDNISQQTVNEDRLRRIELLEKNVHSLDGLKEMVEAFISGDYDYQGGLSDNNFTDELKEKLEGLSNYDDTQLRQLLADINTAKANTADVYTKSEIDNKLGDIQGALIFDDTPTAGSDNPVKSSGIKAYVDSHQVTTDAAPTQESTNPVSSGGVYTALQGKQNTISDLETIRMNASNAVKTETDPTVPQWAKTANKPTYTAQEVGALPADTQFMNINGANVKSNNSINVYTQTAADSRFASKTELSGYATETYVNNALVNVVYAGEDVGSASSEGDGEGGGDVTPSGDYVTTSDFNAAMLTKANDNAVVHKTGSETISGEKNFNDRILLHSTVASEQEPVEGEEQANITEDTVLSGSYIYHQGHTDFSWITTSADEKTDVGDSISLQSVLDKKVSTSSNRLLPTVTTSNNGKILKVVNGTWTLADGATSAGGSGVDSTAVHQTGTETVDGVKTLIGTLAVEDGRGGQISCTDLNNFDWIVVRGGTTLQSVLTAMTNRIAALETKLASIYSYDSSTNTLTINDPNGNA